MKYTRNCFKSHPIIENRVLLRFSHFPGLETDSSWTSPVVEIFVCFIVKVIKMAGFYTGMAPPKSKYHTVQFSLENLDICPDGEVNIKDDDDWLCSSGFDDSTELTTVIENGPTNHRKGPEGTGRDREGPEGTGRDRNETQINLDRPRRTYLEIIKVIWNKQR